MTYLALIVLILTTARGVFLMQDFIEVEDELDFYSEESDEFNYWAARREEAVIELIAFSILLMLALGFALWVTL